MLHASGGMQLSVDRQPANFGQSLAYESMMRPTPTRDGLPPELHREHIEALMTGPSTHLTLATGSPPTGSALTTR
jgi:hypothetical protein